jgi:hypothetical protein
MNHDLQAALDDCLQSLLSGTDLSVCLARYPQHVSELRPLLELAVTICAVSTPAPVVAARVAGLDRALQAVAERRAFRSKPAFAFSFGQRTKFGDSTPQPRRARPALQMAFALVIVLAVVIGGAFAASAASLPGDVLYPVKLAGQQVQVTLMWDDVTRQQLEEQFSAQQRTDIQIALQARRHAAIQLQGTAEQIGGNVWVINGLRVSLEPAASVMGQPHIGDWVVMRGRLPGDGSIVATEIIVTEGQHGRRPQASPYATKERSAAPQSTPASNTPESRPDNAPVRTRVPQLTPGAKATPEAKPTPELKPTHEPKPTSQEKPTNEPKAPTEPKSTKEPKSKGSKH